MKIFRIQSAFRRMAWPCARFACLGISATHALGQADKDAGKPPTKAQAATAKGRGAKRARPTRTTLPPLPADAHAQQSMQLNGKTLNYTVTVGALPVRDKDGKTAGEVVVTAYTVEGETAR